MISSLLEQTNTSLILLHKKKLSREKGEIVVWNNMKTS